MMLEKTRLKTTTKHLHTDLETSQKLTPKGLHIRIQIDIDRDI